jgi:outer membrane protein assembly factor BamD (BamD/ComL family)
VFLCVLVACSAPAPPPDLARGEALARDGRDAEAVAAFEAAARACTDVPAPPSARARFCAAALRERAETLEHAGRRDEAAAAYEAVPAAVPRDPATAAAALAAAARIRLALGQDAPAYDLLWRIVVDYPDESAAEDAVRIVVADGRRRDPHALYGALRDLYARLVATAVGDNLLWAMAHVARDDLHDEAQAQGDLDRLVVAHPKSPFVDDALWEGAELARARHDAEGAARRLRALLGLRETSVIAGSYYSVYMPRAELELGRILRDDLHRPAEALAAFARLSADYPKSRYLDDALYETAVTRAGLGDAGAACRDLAELARRWPESRYLLGDAPALAARLGCH